MSPDEPLVMCRKMAIHFILCRVGLGGEGVLAIRRQGDLAVHRQQYFVYEIFDDRLVKILHHPKVMHNHCANTSYYVIRRLVAASDIGRAII